LEGASLSASEPGHTATHKHSLQPKQLTLQYNYRPISSIIFVDLTFKLSNFGKRY